MKKTWSCSWMRFLVSCLEKAETCLLWYKLNWAEGSQNTSLRVTRKEGARLKFLFCYWGISSRDPAEKHSWEQTPALNTWELTAESVRGSWETWRWTGERCGKVELTLSGNIICYKDSTWGRNEENHQCVLSPDENMGVQSVENVKLECEWPFPVTCSWTRSYWQGKWNENPFQVWSKHMFEVGFGTGFEDLQELFAVEWETLTCSDKLGTHFAVSHTLLKGRAIRSSDVTKYTS